MLNAVIWAFIISFFICLVMRMRRGWHTMHERHGGQDALDIAKERYAKGEVNHDEFDRTKKLVVDKFSSSEIFEEVDQEK